jgi:hypothetical protein
VGLIALGTPGWRPGLAGALVSALLAMTPLNAGAQLLSPGRLSAPHADLEGVRRCTSCHQLGERGVSNGKCLECHTLLKDRIARDDGYHAKVKAQSCGECHQDHFGREFETVRLDTAAYDHKRDVGFELKEAHAELKCRDCHQPALIQDRAVRDTLTRHQALEGTFLGLGTTCVACHRNDDPHAGQFKDQSCDECHNEADWKRPDRFDHAETRYPLTGRHRQVQCRECHEPLPGKKGSLKLTGVAFAACTDCHRDPHAGRMTGRCESCHTTGGWTNLDKPSFERRFDHSKTRFPLVGKHAQAQCAGCHDPARARTATIALRFENASRGASYPRPAAAQCISCHVDAHRGQLLQMAGGIECKSCHGQDGWLPATFGLARHDKDTDYPLTGAHRAAPCLACHKNPELGQREFTFAIAVNDRTCLRCHRSDDPHAGQFPNRACDTCHDTRSFRVASFDHATTRYPLDGAHRTVACNACHPLVTEKGRECRRYRPLGTKCRDCHGEST